MRPRWNLAIPLLACTAFALVCVHRLAVILHQDLVPDMAFTEEQLHALHLSPLPERMSALERKVQALERRLPGCHELQVVVGGEKKVIPCE